MKSSSWTIPMACCIPLLCSCAPFENLFVRAPKPSVVAFERSSGDSPEALHQLARYYQTRGRYDEAIAIYRRVLAMQPNSVVDQNGLAVCHALQGKYDEAIAEFKQALQREPAAAYVLGNLGYTYHLKGDEHEAIATWEQALALEAGNASVRKHLAQAYERGGAGDKAMALNNRPEPTATVASATASAATTVATPNPGLVTATPVAPPVQIALQPASSEGALQLVQLEPQVFELRPALRPTPVAKRPTREVTGKIAREETADKTTKIEVSNGNGVNGLARKVGEFLSDKGYVTARRTNQETFQVAQTHIDYRSGNQPEAARLSALLPGKPNVVQADGLRQDINIRVVLGKDAIQHVAKFEAGDPKILLAHNQSESNR